MKKIPLTKGKYAMIDDQDFDLVIAHKWSAQKGRNGFCASSALYRDGKKIKTLLMHRLILDPAPGKQVDHKDGNGLNNRRENIRVVSARENMRAFQTKRPNCSSKYRGVSWNNRRQIWICQVKMRSGGEAVRKFHAAFASEKEAAEAYNAAALALGFLPEALNKIA